MTQVLGAHFSVAGGLENAIFQAKALNCSAVQIFTQNARAWKNRTLDPQKILAFKTARKKANIKWIFSHCSYLINIASPDKDKLKKSRNALKAELIRSGRLGIDAVVLHPGAHLGHGMVKGLDTAQKSLDMVLAMDHGEFPKLLIETTAGTGTSLGGRFDQIARLIESLDRPAAVGVCLDTCHAFAGGYDLRTQKALDHTLDLFDDQLGLSQLCLVHMNDSKTTLGSARDRHEHIGQGQIGTNGFKAIMNHPLLAHIPKILETPKELNGKAMDPVNLDLLRNL